MQVVGTLYTHHQKCTIVDTLGPGNKRKLTSFIGGLDLCDGRFDTPTHSLFSTLNTFHKNDFHNPTFTVSSLFAFHDGKFLLLITLLFLCTPLSFHNIP